MLSYDNFKMLIGTMIIIGFFATLAALFFVPIPVGNKMAVDIILGVLGTLTVSISQYLFGSSRGSKEKDAVIAKLKAEQEIEPHV